MTTELDVAQDDDALRGEVHPVEVTAPPAGQAPIAASTVSALGEE